MPPRGEDPKDRIRLQHIYDAAKEATLFVSKKSKGDFLKDRKLALALVKEIEIIGEAASRISTSFRRSHSEIPWGILVDTRNRLIHGYFDIDFEVVWDTVQDDLPKLMGLIKPKLKHR